MNSPDALNRGASLVVKPDRDTTELKRELRGVARIRLARSRAKTDVVMRKRSEAKAAFNEAMAKFAQRQSVLIPKA